MALNQIVMIGIDQLFFLFHFHFLNENLIFAPYNF
jgi:hypothetical protein